MPVLRLTAVFALPVNVAVQTFGVVVVHFWVRALIALLLMIQLYSPAGR